MVFWLHQPPNVYQVHQNKSIYVDVWTSAISNQHGYDWRKLSMTNSCRHCTMDKNADNYSTQSCCKSFSVLKPNSSVVIALVLGESNVVHVTPFPFTRSYDAVPGWRVYMAFAGQLRSGWILFKQAKFGVRMSRSAGGEVSLTNWSISELKVTSIVIYPRYTGLCRILRGSLWKLQREQNGKLIIPTHILL